MNLHHITRSRTLQHRPLRTILLLFLTSIRQNYFAVFLIVRYPTVNRPCDMG